MHGRRRELVFHDEISLRESLVDITALQCHPHRDVRRGAVGEVEIRLRALEGGDRLVGVGGGGGSIVSEIGRSLEKASFIVVDTDIRAMRKKSGIKYFYFGQAVTHGLGTGMNPELAREAAEKEKEKISKLLEGQDIIILVASLGGGLGSGAAPVFAEISRNLNNVTLGIFTLPFRFEGKKKAKISHKALQNLKEHLNALITIPNERIFKVIDEKTSITKAFSLVNKNLIESLESLIDLIYNPGLINIDFADVRAILKGQGMMAFLNTAEASGKARAEEIVDKILNNPLFDSNIKAEKILFNIAGGNNLSMIEVEKISRGIAELNPKAKIIFGISKNQKGTSSSQARAKNKIKTTLLITGPSYFDRSEKQGSTEPKARHGSYSPIALKLKEKPQKTLPVGRKEEKKKFTKKEQKPKSIKIPAKAGSRKMRKKNKKPSFVSISAKSSADKKATEDKEKKSGFITPFVKNSIPIAIGMSPGKSVDENKKIRRTALEIKKAQEIEEEKKLNQESEWEIPAFLRRMKFKA